MSLPQPQAAPRCAIYVRVSTPGQEQDGTSLKTQEERCRAYAEEHGWEIVGVFSDTSSGAHLHERAQMSALRDLVRTGAVDVVLAYALDRLSRNQAHVYILDDEFQHHGCRLDFVTESYEDSAVGRFIRSGKAFAAEVEREKILERSMRGKRDRVKAGKYLPGPRPRYGYMWPEKQITMDGVTTVVADKSKLEEDPVRGSFVRRMFAMAEAGLSLRAITLRLQDDGAPLPAAHSSAWRHTAVRGILKDPIYTGQAASFRYEGRTVRNRNGETYKRIFPRDDAELLPEGTAPALVSVDVFAAVQERLTLNKRFAVRNNHDPEQALLRAGYVRCGYCGKSMVVASRNGLYKCIADGAQTSICTERPSISIRRIDGELWARVMEILTHPELIAGELARLEADDPTTADLAAVDRTIAKAKKTYQDQLASVAAMGHMLSEDAQAALAETLRNTERTITAHEQERDAILARRQTWERAREQTRALEAYCGDVAGKLGNADYQHRRLALEALNVQAHVYKATRTPHWELTWGAPFVDETFSRSEHNIVWFRWHP